MLWTRFPIPNWPIRYWTCSSRCHCWLMPAGTRSGSASRPRRWNRRNRIPCRASTCRATCGSPVRSAAVADTPVVKQGNAPDVVPHLIGRYVLAAFADHNRHLAFVVEVSDALGKRNAIFRSGNLCQHFPKTPLPCFFSFTSNFFYRHVGLAEPVGPHSQEMSGVVAADASDATLRPWSMKLHP